MTKSALIPAGKSDDVVGIELGDQQLRQIAEIARVDLEAGADVLARLGADELSRAEWSVMRAGAYFLKLKQVSGHGGFAKALAEVGVHEKAAQRAMQVSRFIGSLPAADAKKLASLPKHKVLPLINAEPEVVTDLLESGELDGEQPLSVRELRDRIRQLENDKTRAETDAARARKMLSARSSLRDEVDLPETAREARQEALALSEEIGFALESLEDVAQRTLIQTSADPEVGRWQPIAAGTFVHALSGVLARGVTLLRRLQDSYADIGTVPQGEQLLTEVELVQFAQARENLLARHLTAARRRADDRANTTPGKRGRKRGAGSSNGSNTYGK